jgi:hypothetical protein
VSLSIALPPRNTFFNLALSTGLSLLASYISPDIIPVIGADKLVIPGSPSDNELSSAIEAFVEELRKGEYGFMPRLSSDINRLSDLGDFLSKVSGAAVELRADAILDAYAKYTRDLAKKGQLVSEFANAFSEFKDGYPNDAAICEVPMLTMLAPEFMEGIRVLGTVGFGAVSGKFAFSKMRIGPHSACIGIAGLWASLIAVEDNLEYFVMPYMSAPGLKVKKVEEEKEGKIGDQRSAMKNVMRSLRGCVPRYIPSLALAVALSTAGIAAPARRMVLVVVQRGGRRVDLMEQGLPISFDTILAFADELYREDLQQGEDASQRLLNLVAEGLREPAPRAKDAQYARKLHEAGLRTAQLVYLALERTLRPYDLRYELARLLYAQSDAVFEEYAKRRKAFLKPYEVERIVSVVERVLREAEAQAGVPLAPVKP